MPRQNQSQHYETRRQRGMATLSLRDYTLIAWVDITGSYVSLACIQLYMCSKGPEARLRHTSLRKTLERQAQNVRWVAGNQ